MQTNGLTKRQREIYDFIASEIRERGYPPTVREIGKRFGIRSPNGTMCHLKSMRKKNVIDYEPHKPRTIRLLPQQSQSSVTDQLRELIPVADKMGLYDAGDYLRNAVEPRNDDQTEDA